MTYLVMTFNGEWYLKALTSKEPIMKDSSLLQGRLDPYSKSGGQGEIPDPGLPSSLYRTEGEDLLLSPGHPPPTSTPSPPSPPVSWPSSTYFTSLTSCLLAILQLLRLLHLLSPGHPPHLTHR